jgi:hypothetical protein
VEVVDEPRPAPLPSIGRIKHANGENAAVDFDTLDRLVAQAQAARRRALIQSEADAKFFA